jgi:transposase InsO family protein
MVKRRCSHARRAKRFTRSSRAPPSVASVAEARTLIEAWRIDYNTVRPHSALHKATPEQFANSLCGRSPAQTPARADWEDKKTKNEDATKPKDLSLSV